MLLERVGGGGIAIDARLLGALPIGEVERPLACTGAVREGWTLSTSQKDNR